MHVIIISMEFFCYVYVDGTIIDAWVDIHETNADGGAAALWITKPLCVYIQ